MTSDDLPHQDSLEQALLRSNARADEPPEMRTPRRSRSAHYGCVRHTLRFLLRGFGVSVPEWKRLSLLLRAELLGMAQHDLGFVPHVSPAERSILNIACRQLAYKAAKLGCEGGEGRAPPAAGAAAGAAAAAATAAAGLPLSVAELAATRERIQKLQTTLLSKPGAAPSSTAPPPLILCESDAHLGRPSLAALLGAAGRPLLPSNANTGGESGGAAHFADFAPPGRTDAPAGGSGASAAAGARASSVSSGSSVSSASSVSSGSSVSSAPVQPVGSAAAAVREAYALEEMPCMQVLTTAPAPHRCARHTLSRRAARSRHRSASGASPPSRSRRRARTSRPVVSSPRSRSKKRSRGWR